ncbi:protein rds1 [Trichoderma asperellum]|uniref:Protein rds1 n=1 Tax=Trichoderma asperellum TaxID=101201 RepID=A0A6V8QHS5_TRIAP|nr:protein rds1 [Trichoderma asperellum]
MFFSQAAIAFLAAGLVAAAPVVEKRATITDSDILNYALTLEHLEDTFYHQGLANFTQADFAKAGYDAIFYDNVQKLSIDESTHVSFLTSALKAAGATPVNACSYSFGVTDVASFLATASILEGVGVSAYLGAAADIMSKTYLTAAGSILTVEARHSSYLRAHLKEAPFPQPFDAPLTLDEVYSLASGFITSCPSSNPPLPVKAFPKLQLAPTTAMPVTAGATVTLLTPGYTLKAEKGIQIYAAFIAVTGPTFVPAKPVNGGFSIMLPKGFAGQTYVVLTTCKEGVSDDTTAAGPAIIEISS